MEREGERGRKGRGRAGRGKGGGGRVARDGDAEGRRADTGITYELVVREWA